MSRLLITNGVQEGRVLRLKSGVNRIGRSIDNHLQVPDPSVSSAHCEIIFSDSSVLVRDLNSTNGTYIDGEQVQEATIRLGQKLQLGNIEMRLEDPISTGQGPAVAIPEIPTDKPILSGLRPDGSLTCANHPELPGVYKCTACQQALCESCVRVIHRVSGGTMIFCSLCAGACESLLAPAPPPRRKGFLGRLTQTLRLPFRKNRPA